ncbi:6,7-dimethyl-8-ribityllumazine synthase [Limobrevibacterium gyesilva]|uniref:6,7-dimethyl-8-ribityllumazine synthase n=1 Tax=Limobrevibacterium gyesilva TaxID=2991712 RepID=A0AA42CET5_9PROT|nr:6,7-dimethyl-8-ribityllumazine synthase [Limobrevibacterium gyesilva]MCW3473956.1 6,7-dimethyl-8-ribityllumazine synthase [Limobrevibacterium gyesilva]
MSTADAPLPAAPKIEGPAPHMLIVRAPYYNAIVDGLRDGATRILADAGATFDVLDVAGALELAGAVRLAVRGSRRFDGYVALGCVVRGETDHYDHVCREAMAGLTNVALQFGLCLGNGLLTVHTERQALERASQDGHNKGAEAAAAALVQLRAARWLGAV